MHIIKLLLYGFKVRDSSCESYTGFRVVYLRHSGIQHFSRFRSKPGFQGDESYCYAPAVINPSVFSFKIQPNNQRKVFVSVFYAGFLMHARLEVFFTEPAQYAHNSCSNSRI